MTEETKANSELVLRYMERAQAMDVDGAMGCLAEECVRVFPRPGIHAEPETRGRAAILAKLPHLTLYERGSLRMKVENILADGSLVAVQFVLRATTARGEPYENFYFHLFECHDGLITKFWEYNDTLHGARMLRPELLSGPQA